MPDALITENEIAARVVELAREVDDDYAYTDELILIGVLKGSFIFLADLARRLKVNHRVEFIAVSSYGESEDTTHSGAVRLLMDVRLDISDKDVLIVEDIVDSGNTLEYLYRVLKARGPRSLKTATLLRKPDRLEVDVEVNYLGFDIPDVWVVGYGLDWAERYRTLPYIGKINPAQ
ncbi:MAG: hypoxanthine phosphoribosyltransferase [Acidimicrobiia bacterium]|nr:hypoxanthine phosphoribosyltransferase [Acidimicrobiia bacterium]